MRIVLIVEGEADKTVLQYVLDDLKKLSTIEFFVANGRNAGRPIARHLLMQPSTAVALIYDSDTLDEVKVYEEKRALEGYFSWSANQNSFLVQPIVPELEVLFFEVPDVLEGAIGIRVNQERQFAGHYAPKKILSELLKEAKIEGVSQLASKIGVSGFAKFREIESMLKIRAFVQSAAAL